jgi:hypothetical protein
MATSNHLSLTVEIKRPAKIVWKHLVDWNRQSDWMLQTKVWSSLDQDRTVKNGKGVLIFAFTGLFPKLSSKNKIRCARYHGGYKVAATDQMREVVHIGRIIRGTGKFELVEKKV